MKLKSYESYKDSGIEWLGEIPSEWKIDRVKNIATVRGRVGWKALKASEYVEKSEYIFLATPNIKDEEIDFQNVNYLTKERYYESPEIMLKINDILLAKDGSTLGTVNIIKYLPTKATVNSSIAVGVVIAIDGKSATVPGEGNWTVDLVTGDITFTPEVGFVVDPTPITYTVKDSVGQVSNVATETIDYPQVPDYRPTVNILVGQTVNTPTMTLKVTFRIVENINGMNTGPVVVRIPKHSTLVTTYDAGMTTLHGSDIDNADWSFVEESAAYVLTYIGNGGDFTPEAESYIGFEFDFTAPSTQKGKIPVKATIQGSLAGDTVPSNDVDEDFLIFNNL